MTIRFQNLRTDGTSVFISFGGAGTLTGTNLANHAALVKGTGYSLSELSAGVNITQFTSGRIYLSLDAQLVTPDAANGYSPNFDNPALGDFATRWDKIEITVTPGAGGTSGGANLSSQDFFGMPLQISTSGGKTAPAKLTWRQNSATVFGELAVLSNYSILNTRNTAGAIALGNNGVTVAGVNGGAVVRIVSPGSVAPLNPSAGTTVYPSLAGYVSYLRSGAVRALIAGNNGAPTPGGPQTYDLTGTIAASAMSIGGAYVQAGDLVLTGTINNGDGGGNMPYTVVVPAHDLSDYGIYGANPSYTTVPAGSNPYGIVQKVTADYFAALNFGLIGSPVANPNQPGSTIGNSPSWTWYGNEPNGSAGPKLPIGDAFGHAQPGNPGRYNQYAAYLASVTDSYGFAYNDRLQSPLASLGDATLITLSVLPDSQ